jgi:methyl-CpG-binding domain protein 4
VYEELFDCYPTPASLRDADVLDLQNLIKPLGLWKRRTETLQRFSREYLEKDWVTPKELYGCGRYAEDAWRVFCVGDWKDVQPNDHALNKYRTWLEENYA